MAPWPPLSSVEQGANGQKIWSGFEIDLMREVCRRIQAECSFEEVPFNDSLEPPTDPNSELGLFQRLDAEPEEGGGAQVIDLVLATMRATKERFDRYAASNSYYIGQHVFISQKTRLEASGDIESRVSQVDGKDLLVSKREGPLVIGAIGSFIEEVQKLYEGLQTSERQLIKVVDLSAEAYSAEGAIEDALSNGSIDAIYTSDGELSKYRASTELV